VAVDTFQAKHRQLRNSWVALNRQEATRLWGVFDTFLQDVRGEIEKYYSPGRAWLSSERRVALRGALEIEAARFAESYEDFIHAAMRRSARVPLHAQAAARQYYADLCRTEGARAIADELETLNLLMFSQVPTATIEALWNRVVKGMVLSDRIWDLTEAGMADIQQTLVAGAIAGKDVGWVSRAVERHIRPGQKGPGWTSRGKPAKRPLPDGGYVGMKGRPAMYYAAARLTRTEMRLCAHDGHVRGHVATRTLMEPEGLNYLQGIKWQLSVSHPAMDQCDDYAAGGSAGLPPGVYHPEDVPSSHPL